MIKNLVMTSNSEGHYVIFALHALYTFLKHNAGWQVTVLDVGLRETDRSLFGQVATVTPYAPFGGEYPSALARCLMLRDFCQPGQLLCYLDSDCVVHKSIAPLAEAFNRSPAAVALCREVRTTMGYGYRTNMEKYFPRFSEWAQKRVYNTGFMLAHGMKAQHLGIRSAQLLHLWGERNVVWGEQSAIAGILYDEGWRERGDLLLLSGEYNEMNENAVDPAITHYCGPKAKKRLALRLGLNRSFDHRRLAERYVTAIQSLARGEGAVEPLPLEQFLDTGKDDRVTVAKKAFAEPSRVRQLEQICVEHAQVIARLQGAEDQESLRQEQEQLQWAQAALDYEYEKQKQIELEAVRVRARIDEFRQREVFMPWLPVVMYGRRQGGTATARHSRPFKWSAVESGLLEVF